MKHSILKLAVVTIGLLATQLSLQAADVIKADNANDLNVGSSWVGNAPPGSADVAVWNSTVTAANTALLGTDTNWAGIRIANPAGEVAISPTFSVAGVTATLNSPTLTYAVAPATPLVNGNRVSFAGTTAPTGLPFGTYFVVNATPTTFQLSATPGGAAISVGATTAGTAVTVTAPLLILGISGIDLSAATADLVLNNGVDVGASQIWNVAADRTLTISTPVSGTAGTFVTKSGAGTLSLSSTANGSYSGNLLVNGGALVINSANGNNNSALGTGIITNNGATLRLGASRIIGNALHFIGNSVVDCNGFASPLDGAWYADGSTVVVITNLTTGTFTIGGNGNGGGNMTSFTGTIRLADNTAGTVRFNNGGGNPAVGNINAIFDLGAGTASLISRNATTINLGELRGGPGTSLSGQGSGNGTTIWSVGGKNTSSTFEGSISNATATRVSGLTKVGTGTLTLTGTNTHTVNTTISAGTLEIGNGGTSGTVGNGPVVNNATLVFNRSDDHSVSNAISGTGTITKLGAGTLIYNGTNSASGVATISQGALALDVEGWVASPVSIAAGAFFNVATNPLFTVNQTLSGSGAVLGALTAVGGTLSPGGVGAAGTLTFSNGVTESGAVTHQMELTAPAGPNDLINIVGDLAVSGSVTSSIVATRLGGGALPQGVYPLIKYSGNFNGTLDNFSVTVVGVTGTLTNQPNQIALIITAAARGATNLTWKGGGAANSWDDGVSANWVNGLASFTFLAGDSVQFDATGAANPVVNLNSAVLQPATVVVDAASDYTFAGVGSISGSTGLIKTNSGRLIVQTTNSYTGPTVIGAGTLEIAGAANGNSASPLGASSADPTNLVLHGSTLAFAGTDSPTDRGATLNGSGGIFDIMSGNLSFNGSPLTGVGALIKDGIGTLTLSAPNSYAGGTTLSNGVLALGSNAANNNGAGGSGLGPTNSPVTFRGGALQLFGFTGGEGNNYNTLYNPLVVPAGETGELRMFQRGPANNGANAGLQSSLTGAGTLNLVVNYVRDDLSGNWSAFTGHINVLARDSGDEMRVNNNFGYANATITLNDNVSLCRSFTGDTVNDIGALNGTSLATIGIGNSSGPRTTWRVGWLNTDANFGGTIVDDPGGTRIVKVGTGTWTLSGGNTATGPTIISNGVLAVTGSLASTNISVVSGAFLDVSGLASLSLALGQTLGGNGTVRGSVDTSGGGTIAPGFSIGTLTVTNNVTLAGEVVMEVNRTGGVLTSDKLVAASISLGGTLRVVRNGEPLQIGDTFDLFDGALSGGFTTFALGYYTWNTSQLAVNGTITVTGVLPGPTLSVTTTGTDITLNSTSGVPGGQLVVVTSLDIGAPLDSWTPVISDVFDPSGNYTLLVPIDPAAAQRFYAIRAF